MVTGINVLKEIIDLNCDENTLILILFDMNRYFDKELKYEYKKVQKKTGRVFNSFERKILRDYYYYRRIESLKVIEVDDFVKMSFTEEQKCEVIEMTLNRINKYGSDKIVNSIKKRYTDLSKDFKDIKNKSSWLKWYADKNFGDKTNLVIINLDNKIIESKIDVFRLLRNMYTSLNNYRYLGIIIDGEIFDNNLNITWKLIYQISIYLENFVKYTKKYFPVKVMERKKELNEFLANRIMDIDNEIVTDQFYSTISTGCKFEDCFISDDGVKKILIFKKIVLDENIVPCPDCLEYKSSSNSYPEMFLHSWECKNPSCPSRSKSGRGKRYDEFSTYRYLKTIDIEEDDNINENLYTTWRRDIFANSADCIQMLIKFYSWSGEKITTFNCDAINNYSRIIEKVYDTNNNGVGSNITFYNSFEELPIYILLNEINSKIRIQDAEKNTILHKKIEIIHGNSSDYLKKLKKGLVGAAITSPPYYNAREYSQWGNLILYLIDMMDNAKSVLSSMNDNGIYLYNIGDIVSNDNVYVKSNMSKRRLLLGAYSMMIFEIAGFHLANNIIWDKGEVQSKRNSTINMNPGFVKCVNCYEHVIVFSKSSRNIDLISPVVRINPVIKINCKGENIYKHTAPYPEELVQLIKPFVDKENYVLDPYLGSGTTLIWCLKNNFKGLGIEMNNEYYELSFENILKINKKEDE